MAVMLTAFQEQLGLSINPTAVAAGVGSVLTYIFFEAKLDLKVLTSQPSKWKDPKFWLTVISAVLAGIEVTFHIGIPVEAIVSVLTVIVGVLFGAQLKKPKAY
jgi:uncharacterized membrane protein